MVIAFKNVVGTRRASIKILDGKEKKERMNLDGVNMLSIEKINDFRQKITTEMFEIMDQILELIDEYLLPVTHSEEALCFYYKIKAD